MSCGHAGSDMAEERASNASTEEGVRQKIIVETNSCPSGQKSFPALDDGLYPVGQTKAPG